jgi:hypothetical protein
MRRLKRLLNATRSRHQTQPADEAIAKSRKFARFLAIRALGIHRQAAKEALRYVKNRIGTLDSQRTKIVRSRRSSPDQTKDPSLRRNFYGFLRRTVRRKWFTIIHSLGRLP